jgi:hypothetical protein
VVVALGKFYATHIVPDLPAPQSEAMKQYRYIPFPTFNICLTSPGPEPAYDNWFLDAPFTDFIPADWVIHSGRGPKQRKTALTVYHPLPEIRAFRRGHPMFVAAPGRMSLVERAAAAFGPILFANTDSEATVPSFDGALRAATRAAGQARKLLQA